MNAKHRSVSAIFRRLRRLYEAEGEVTIRLVDACPDLPSTCYIRRYFGSLAKATNLAGVPVLSHSEQLRRAWKRRKAAGCDDHYFGVRWTDAALLKSLRTLEGQYGYTSANLIDQNGVTPSAYYYVKRFGSLTKARALAQLPVLTRSELTSIGKKRKKEGRSI